MVTPSDDEDDGDVEEAVSTSKVSDTPVSNTTDTLTTYSVSKSQIKRWVRLRAFTVKTLSFWNHLLFFKEKICQ